ncbi:hypothetical protein [Pseudoalteromonas phenolica]|uniref:Uncharacterized protein n=1 Tax=Pseudoalteromonas phenolica TaxID=161398 RepID=A0A0S2JZ94_9GAMM|nr:hypothetical protein [Pseudoalteromonas phenolica]ALO41172.1 hypothetical protein PP2015_652 [Pseudoalteromonas phenolica]MBE0354293.1 hypothetical protein [Pseudoalteromonas phenolica O-BC30]RXE92269.1 hypothetical protein D9981_21660 [Pseudoalteromonas phenolica O-BC30]TMO57670.1 hypothetical protein CWC21_02205 [Pseudoalteromonas phenolica]|tara:strand:+ start:837 stop:1019 length:183 start_codon:yes stop_codon:yes gene_type:complete
MKLKLQKKPLKSLSQDSALHLQATPQVAGGVKITEWCSRDKKCLVTETCYVTDQKDCTVM